MSVTYWNELKNPRCFLGRDLAEISRRGGVLAAERESLEQAGQQQQPGCGNTDHGIGRQHGDDQRAHAHQRHGKGERGFPAFYVGQRAHDVAADRTDQEPDRVDTEDRHELGRRGGRGRGKLFREIQRERVVDVEIVPLDQVADGTAEDRAQARGHGHLRGWRDRVFRGGRTEFIHEALSPEEHAMF
jgi:hypothetical protein